MDKQKFVNSKAHKVTNGECYSSKGRIKHNETYFVLSENFYVYRVTKRMNGLRIYILPKWAVKSIEYIKK